MTDFFVQWEEYYDSFSLELEGLWAVIQIPGAYAILIMSLVFGIGALLDASFLKSLDKEEEKKNTRVYLPPTIEDILHWFEVNTRENFMERIVFSKTFGYLDPILDTWEDTSDDVKFDVERFLKHDVQPVLESCHQLEDRFQHLGVAFRQRKELNGLAGELAHQKELLEEGALRLYETTSNSLKISMEVHGSYLEQKYRESALTLTPRGKHGILALRGKSLRSKK